MNFDTAADELHKFELARLSATVPPTVETLRSLAPTQLRAVAAATFERRGYELVTGESAADLVITKDGCKYIVAFATPTNLAPTPMRDLMRLHSAVVAAKASAGFFVTPRGFTADAEAYAVTAPIKLVDGPKLVAAIKRSMEGVTMPDTYKAMCRQCGDIVKHSLDRAEAIPCRNGHPVAPTIARAALVPKETAGTSSSSYTPPKQHSRYEVRAHNAKYRAKMKRQKPKPQRVTEPDPPEANIALDLYDH